jgi:HPt (histidine-containing phosphotransfer) domain-containing protein
MRGDPTEPHPDENEPDVPEPDVDEEILSELFVLLDDGTPDGLIKACDMFLVGVPTALAGVRRALSEARVADVGKMAHTLRGTAGAFGATRLGRLAASLEDVCGRTDGASADALVDGMEAEFLAFRTILTSRLAAPTAG